MTLTSLQSFVSHVLLALSESAAVGESGSYVVVIFARIGAAALSFDSQAFTKAVIRFIFHAPSSSTAVSESTAVLESAVATS
jgi:hypothetical protein